MKILSRRRKQQGVKYAAEDNDLLSDRLIEGNDTLAEMLSLTGTPGIIIMPAENATVENTTVLPGVVSEEVMKKAIERARGN